MSRSNPTDSTPNPSTAWFEWSGKNGNIHYYDKQAPHPTEKGKLGANVVVPLPFTFLLLDELAVVKGWHKASDSGIYSNEVRDTRSEVLVVKAFDAGILASGLYGSIRDRIVAHGGHFVASCYIAAKQSGKLAIANLQFKGAGVQAWMDFKKNCTVNAEKKCREYWCQAISITGFKEGKNGAVTFRTPVFALKPCTEETNKEAAALDFHLQEFLTSYFKRTKTEQAERAPVTSAPRQAPADDEPPMQEPEPEPVDPEPFPVDDSEDAPF